MNSIERVTRIINHQEADRVPVYPLINSISYKYCGYDYAEWTQDPDKCAESIIKATDELGVDVICSLVDLSVEAEAFGSKIKTSDDEVPTVIGALITDEDEANELETPHFGADPRKLVVVE